MISTENKKGYEPLESNYNINLYINFSRFISPILILFTDFLNVLYQR